MGTVIDVVENCLEAPIAELDVSRIRPRKLRDLDEAIGMFHENWSPPPLDDGEVRMSYSGMKLHDGLLLPESLDLWDGSVLRKVGTSRVNWIEEHGEGYDRFALEMSPERSHRAQQQLLREFRLRGAGLLYAHRVVDTDPLSGWNARSRDCRGFLTVALRQLCRLEGLIQDQTLILIPKWIIDADDIEELGKQLKGLPDELHSFFPARLLYADRALGQPTPLTPLELEVLSTSLGARSDLRVVQALGAIDLPLLAALSPTDVASVRHSSEAFGHWRDALRLATHMIRAEVSSADFPSQAHQVFSDLLMPAAAAARAEVRRSAALRDAAFEEGERVAMGAAAVGATAAILSSSPTAGLLGLGISALGAVTVRAMFPRRRLDGQARILLSLDQREKRPDADSRLRS